MLTGGPTLTAAIFADLMAPLGPFERSPHVAVAVSGGADSLALLLLADHWARSQGGRAIALTVDHGVRAGSDAEARQVGQWAAERGISHHILRWAAGDAGAGLQAAARAARYRLLGAWCRQYHILHLLLAHHQDDQAETLLLRLARGSGVDGLAAMAGGTAQQDLQILRPLLPVPGRDLRVFLQQQGQGWIEDPSNQAERFDRVRWRKILAAEKIDNRRLAVTARQLGRARQALEQDCALLAVDAVTIAEAGFGWLDAKALSAAPDEVALRLLARLCRTIGGRDFSPRLDPLENLLAALKAGLARRRTVAGCVVAPRESGILVYREMRAIAAPVALAAGENILWDGRFTVKLARGEGLSLGALGEKAAPEWREAAEKQGIPRDLLPSLPALMDKRGILAVPPLECNGAEAGFHIERWGFTPVYPLIGAAFRLVPAPTRIM